MSRKVAIFGALGLVVLAAAAIVVVVVGSGSTKLVTLPTTGNYKPIYVPKPATGFHAHFVEGVDADTLSKQGADLQTIISRAPGSLTANRFRITISNTSSLGYIDSITWSPPNGVQILRVTGSSVGTCTLTGTKGFGGAQFPTAELNPRVTCTGVNLKPPTCTCKGDGGSVVIDFVANEFPDFAGSVAIVSARPVLKRIPSYQQTPDLPTCKAGQTGTSAKPCSSV